MHGYEAIANRMVNAEQDLIDTLAELGGITRAEAEKAAGFYIREKIVKLDPVMGRYNAKHGAFYEPEIIQKAAAQ